MPDTSISRVRGGPVPARAGIGLRSQHHAAILDTQPKVGWLEVHTENYFHDGGPQCAALERAREYYPLSLHGVGLGLGSVDPLDRGHLARVRRAVDRFERTARRNARRSAGRLVFQRGEFQVTRLP